MKRILYFLLTVAVTVILSACTAIPQPNTEPPAVMPSEPVELPETTVEDTFEPIAEDEPAAEPSEPVAEPSEPVTEPEEQTEAELPAAKNKTYLRANTALNVRSGAGTDYKILGTLDRGDMVACAALYDGWYKTYYLGGDAYVKADYVEEIELPCGGSEIERVIEEGEKLLGTPYAYGAVRYHDGSGRLIKNFDINKFDCSSLMQYIFYIGAGKNLTLTTRTQIGQGKRVEGTALERGDLMFFTNAGRKNKTGIERVGHVALYLGGNYILHTASDHAVIEQISDIRWGYFIQANRIIY